MEDQLEELFVTTLDNPYDPFTQLDDWTAFDEELGYHTCSLLARFLKTSNELSDEDRSRSIDEAIETLVRLNPNGKYRKVRGTFLGSESA